MEIMCAMQAVSKDYMGLIHKFPLMPIQTKAQLKRAAAMVDDLSDRLTHLSQFERAYFDVLCDLIKHYEKKTYPYERLEPVEVLKYLMDVNGLTLKDLTPAVRHSSHLSAFLNRKRGLSKANAVRLGDYFRVSPALFLPKTSKQRNARISIRRASA
jgi:HTH-type transcriptional regulator / antitoxin HigA